MTTQRMDNVLIVVQELEAADLYRLCYVRGPEGIVVGLSEELS